MVRLNGRDPLEGGSVLIVWGWRGWEVGCRNMDAGGTPAVPGGHPLHNNPGPWFTSCPGMGQGGTCKPANHFPREGECHPGTRASRPQPCFWLEAVERQRKVAGRQAPCWCERRWPRLNGRDLLEGGSVGIVWGWRGWVAVCRNRDAGGTPAVPGGHLPHHKPETWFTSCPGIRQEGTCKPTNHSPLEGECHPGTRASRPQPYFWLEATKRQRNVAGRQPPCRRERRWPRLTESSTGRWFRCALYGGAVDGRLAAGIRMRAGRPRSRGGILHTINRDHGLHHAQDWGKGAHASRQITSPVRGSATRERGRPARNLISWWRPRSDSATLRASNHPAGVNGDGHGSMGEIDCKVVSVGIVWGWRGWEAGCRNKDAGGTPAVPGGHLPHNKPGTWFTPRPGMGQGGTCKPQNHSPLEGECHPGPRASRPQPFFWLEVTGRQRDVAGMPPPCRRERRWPSSMGEIHLRVVRRALYGGGAEGWLSAGIWMRAGRPRSRGGIFHTTPRLPVKGQVMGATWAG